MAVKSDNSSLPNLQKENLKLATSIFLWTVFAAVLNFIIYMSITMIATGISTKTIGERIYETADDGSRRLITEYTYGDSDTTTVNLTTNTAPTTAKTDAEGTTTGDTTTVTGETSAGTTGTTLPENQIKESFRSEMSAGASFAMDAISQTFMLILFISMIYTKLWERGDKDNNSVHYGRMLEDKYRGLKVGFLAAIPSLLFYIVLILSKLRLVFPNYFFVYRFLNVSFMPIISRFAGRTGVVTTADVSWISLFGMLLTLAILPLTGYIAYLLGYKQISISEKIIYVDPKKRRKRRR